MSSGSGPRRLRENFASRRGARTPTGRTRALDACWPSMRRSFESDGFCRPGVHPIRSRDEGGAVRYRWSGHYDFCFIAAY
eukprot:1903887-Pyramimonas_sp.AAC.1